MSCGVLQVAQKDIRSGLSFNITLQGAASEVRNPAADNFLKIVRNFQNRQTEEYLHMPAYVNFNK